MTAALIDRLAADRSPRSDRLAFTLLLIAVAGGTGILFWTGAAFQSDMGWDPVIMLEAAARWQQGQMPHTDYLSPVGLLPTWLVAVGLRLSGGTAHALAYAPALTLAPLALAAWWLARRRFGAWLSLAFALSVGALVAATRPLPFGMLPYALEFSHTSYAMAYNRLGWALLSLLMLQQFLAPVGGSSVSLRTEHAGAGLLCGLLFLTKVNYAAAAVGVMVVSLVLFRRPRDHWLAFAAGTAVLPAILLAATDFRPGAWLREIAYLGRINPLGERFSRMGELAVNNAAPMAVVAAAYFLLRPLFRLRTTPPDTASAYIPAGVTVAGIGCGLCVLTLNAQLGEVPVFALTALLLAESAARRLTVRDRSEHALRLRHRTALGLALLLGAGTVASDAASLLWPVVRTRHMRARMPAGTGVQSPTLGPLLFPPQRFEESAPAKTAARVLAAAAPGTPYEYGLVVNDGLALLAPHTDAGSRIMTFDLANPFPFALRRPYPRGGTLWWAWNTFSRDVHPPAAELFRDVTHLMIPKAPVLRGGEVAALQAVYRTELDARFTRVAESNFWILLRHR